MFVCLRVFEFPPSTRRWLHPTDAIQLSPMATEVATVRPPTRYPVSMLCSLIQDDVVLAQLAEEDRLRQEQARLREAMRQAKAQRDQLLRSRNSHKSATFEKSEGSMNELREERRVLYAELDALREEQSRRPVARTAVQNASYDLNVQAKLVTDAQELLNDAQQELSRLQKAKATVKVAEQRKRVDAVKKQYEAELKAKLEKEETLQRCTAALEECNASARPKVEVDAKFNAIRGRISVLQTELDRLNKTRRQATMGDGAELDAARSEMDAAMASLTAVERAIDAVRETLFPPAQHFTYPPAHHPALIGRAGATLRQLQYDFGVAVCVDTVPAGHGFIVGAAPEAAACIAAISAIMQDEAKRGVRATLKLTDATLRKELIGPRGATIDGFQTEYAVHMNLSDGAVEFTGTAEDVEAAKAAVQSFLESFQTEEMKVDGKSLHLLIGRGGRTIGRITEMSGVRNLRVDRERGVVRALGTAEAIKAALEECRIVLAGSGAAAAGMTTKAVHADDAMMRAVIGAKGATVRRIEDTSGARVHCGGTTITIMGTAEAVEAAHQQVMALRRAERVVAVDPKRMYFLTAPVVSIASVQQKEEETEAIDGSSSAPRQSGSSSCISPLEALRRATLCDQAVPLRVEGKVILRGHPDAVAAAHAMLRVLLENNTPSSLLVPYPTVLRSFIGTRQPEWNQQTLLDHVQGHYSAALRLNVDWSASQVTATSCNKAEAKAAAEEVAEQLKAYIAAHVRVIRDVPESRFSQLIGPRGATIQQLQLDTDTEIALARQRCEVQLLDLDGNAEKLDAAQNAVMDTIFGAGWNTDVHGESEETATI